MTRKVRDTAMRARLIAAAETAEVADTGGFRVGRIWRQSREAGALPLLAYQMQIGHAVRFAAVGPDLLLRKRRLKLNGLGWFWSSVPTGVPRG
jgi:hypothetical protein